MGKGCLGGTKGGNGGDGGRGEINTISDVEWARLDRDPVESPKWWARLTHDGDSARNRERN